VTEYGKDDRVDVFSNGTEHMMWLESNCMRGKRGCRKYNPNASSSRHGCPIEVAVALAGGTDGKIPARIALRGGFLEEGPNGKLTDDCRSTIASDGLPATVIPACPEYKGYDEPDDRPRRGPQPPKEQLDLLDPRNVPERPRVAS
jgi:hypothetical protein